MIPRPEDLVRVLPETIWCIFGVVLMLLQPFTRNRNVLSFFAVLGAIFGAASTIYAYTTIGPGTAFNGLIQFDAFSIFFHLLIGLVYGVTGTTNRAQMGAADSTSNLLKLGLSLILIGLGFKVAAAPFQLWTPDVYEGAPTPVTALFS